MEKARHAVKWAEAENDIIQPHIVMSLLDAIPALLADNKSLRESRDGWFNNCLAEQKRAQDAEDDAGQLRALLRDVREAMGPVQKSLVGTKDWLFDTTRSIKLDDLRTLAALLPRIEEAVK